MEATFRKCSEGIMSDNLTPSHTFQCLNANFKWSLTHHPKILPSSNLKSQMQDVKNPSNLFDWVLGRRILLEVGESKYVEVVATRGPHRGGRKQSAKHKQTKTSKEAWNTTISKSISKWCNAHSFQALIGELLWNFFCFPDLFLIEIDERGQQMTNYKTYNHTTNIKHNIKKPLTTL